MLAFVNAKLNLGLRVVRRLPSGYHELETIFYPVGLYNGTPQCPYPFCDLLEVNTSEKDEFLIEGADWNPADDLAMRARSVFGHACGRKGVEPLPTAIRVEKHLPMQAGMGGGSADGAFTLKMLNAMNGQPFDDEELSSLALRLGADCPFFILNCPALAGGVGERLTPLPERLNGMWCAIAKPAVNMPTAKAFSLITPTGESGTLRAIYEGDMSLWCRELVNDFECPFLELYPDCVAIKERLYAEGAIYASLTGSGAAFFGIFATREEAEKALKRLDTPYKALALL